VPPGDSLSLTGRTYGEWSAEWWKWAFALDFAPVNDETGGNCALGQTGEVWFLAGMETVLGPGTAPPVERKCSIPGDKRIFIPIIDYGYYPENNAHNDNVTPYRQFLRNKVDQWLRKATLSLTVDGTTLGHEQLLSYRFASPVFEVITGDGTVYDRTVADGVYVLLEPLGAGLHKVKLTVQGWGAMNVTYDLEVEGGS
jgi:hypothetical protein